MACGLSPFPKGRTPYLLNLDRNVKRQNETCNRLVLLLVTQCDNRGAYQGLLGHGSVEFSVSVKLDSLFA